MRLCRYEHRGYVLNGFYLEDKVLSLARAAEALRVTLPDRDSLLPLLPGGTARAAVRELESRLAEVSAEERAAWELPLDEVSLHVPIPNPSKLLLLAGNYSKHIEEGG